MKRRSRNTKLEKDGVIHVRKICNDSGHIFREVQEEDVGIDAHIEFCRESEEPTGIVVGLQIKSGESYICSENDTSFTFYPDIDDLQYWRSYVLPLYLIVYQPSCDQAYWTNVKKQLSKTAFEDMLSGLKPKKLIFEKANILSKNFFPGEFTNLDLDDWAYNSFLESVSQEPTDSAKSPFLPLKLLTAMHYLGKESVKVLLNYIESKQDEFAKRISGKILEKVESDRYVEQIIINLREDLFKKESTGFCLLAFDEKENRDTVTAKVEEVISANRYLILKGERIYGNPSWMNHVLLVAVDDWGQNEEVFGRLFTTINTQLGLQCGSAYEADFHGPQGASIFFTPNYYMQYRFEKYRDTDDELALFDLCRRCVLIPVVENEENYIWVSVGKERVKVYQKWEPALYGYFLCIRSIRTGGEWLPYYEFLLDIEFDVSDQASIDEFIAKAKSAKCLRELPLMTDNMFRELYEGIEWGKNFYGDRNKNEGA